MGLKAKPFSRFRKIILTPPAMTSIKRLKKKEFRAVTVRRGA